MTGRVRQGVAAMAVTALLSVWITIVHDDGQGAGQFMIVLAAMMAGHATGLEGRAMARAAAGLAAMQAALGALVATAPVTAFHPGGVAQVIVLHAALATGWAISALLFGRAREEIA